MSQETTPKKVDIWKFPEMVYLLDKFRNEKAKSTGRPKRSLITQKPMSRSTPFGTILQ